MDDDTIGQAAAELLGMRRTRRIEVDLPPLLRPAQLADAYAIQERVVDGLLPEGARRIGYKVACTNPIAQQALRIDRPVFGQLMSHTTSPTGATLPADGFLHRVIEAEFAFRLARDVEPTTNGHTCESIAEFIDAVIPGIEIVDYRYEAWTIGALQVAADNAIHGWWVRGEPVVDWCGHDLAACAVRVRQDGALLTAGTGAAVLGHPLQVMAWLADELPRFGRRLRAGDVVTTGVATDVFEAAAGDRLVAEFDGLGEVTVAFA